MYIHLTFEIKLNHYCSFLCLEITKSQNLRIVYTSFLNGKNVRKKLLNTCLNFKNIIFYVEKVFLLRKYANSNLDYSQYDAKIQTC